MATKAALSGLILGIGLVGGLAWADSTDAAPSTAVAEPALGMNLIGISDWSAENPFIDLMRASRPWVGSTDHEWAVWDSERLAGSPYLSPEGWPREFPPGVTRFDTLVLTDQSESAQSIAGTYLLRWEGRARVWLTGLVEDVQEGDHSLRFTYRPGQGAVIISMNGIDPTEPFGDMTLVHEDDLALFEGGAVFNPDFLARIQDFRALRFMDWMATNGSSQAAWENRPRVGDATWMPKGVPVEIMVQLANEVGADPWFTMPHQADDAYVAAFAEYVRDHLDPRLKVYEEWSNEVWNWIFPQTEWANERALERWNVEPGGDAWMQFAGLRAAEVADIWAETFGEQATERLVRVIAVQTGWLGLEGALLEAPLVVAEGRPAPAESFDAYAVTGYFGHSVGSEEMVPKLHEWKAAGIAEEEMTALTRADLDHLIHELLPYHAQVAGDHGLQLVAYEGGTHIVGTGAAMDDHDITDLLTAFNYGPEMGSFYRDLLAAWDKVGGTQFMHYVDVLSPSKYGSFGALRHLDDENGRWDALMEVNGRPPEWEDREFAAFAQGVQIIGSESGETLTGTTEEDDLLGQGGDDVLVSGGGADRLDGGGGHDRAVLPGMAEDWTRRADGVVTFLTHGRLTIRVAAIEELVFAGSGEVEDLSKAP